MGSQIVGDNWCIVWVWKEIIATAQVVNSECDKEEYVIVAFDENKAVFTTLENAAEEENIPQALHLPEPRYLADIKQLSLVLQWD